MSTFAVHFVKLSRVLGKASGIPMTHDRRYVGTVHEVVRTAIRLGSFDPQAVDPSSSAPTPSLHDSTLLKEAPSHLPKFPF